MAATTERAILAGGCFWGCSSWCSACPASSRRGSATRAATSRPQAVAGKGRDRALARWRFLGGGARAPGLPGTLPERLHLPLRPPAVEVAAQERRLTAIALSVACGKARPHGLCAVRRARRPHEVAHNTT